MHAGASDCAHTLPILFAFTTPAKYCFRAIATFIRHAMDTAPRPPPTTPALLSADVLEVGVTTSSPASTQVDLLNGGSGAAETTPSAGARPSSDSTPARISTSQSDPVPHARAKENETTATEDQATENKQAKGEDDVKDADKSATRSSTPVRRSVRRVLSASVTRASVFLRRQDVLSAPTSPTQPHPPPHAQLSGSDEIGRAHV